MVLRTPFAQPEQLRSSLSRVSISLEARVVNSPASDRDAPPASEIVYNGIVREDQEPFIVTDEVSEGVEEGSEARYSYAIWKLSVTLARPRMRLQGPSIVFQATSSVRIAGSELSGSSRKGYLQSGVPSGLNLLGSFNGDPACRASNHASQHCEYHESHQPHNQPTNYGRSKDFKVLPSRYIRCYMPGYASPDRTRHLHLQLLLPCLKWISRPSSTAKSSSTPLAFP